MTKHLLGLIAFVWLVATAVPAVGSADSRNFGYDEGVAAYSRGDWTKAFDEWEPLARSGNAPAQNNLGILYKYGRGVPLDYGKAADWYRRAAEQGHPSAQFNLGLMFDNGLGVRQDFQEAAKWFGLAARQGVARAQTFLGMMYWVGKGVEEDRALAFYWTTIAAQKGDELARRNRRQFAKDMTESEIDRANEMVAPD